ncbi:small, acid-soluble spore protein, alpha/beta type [Cohnella soli]|uniref:Small, acid-soluble spore protein, alpha/beta type n=1 Tax=Cohnella soli TaxID=425005 RepID=A0ABW0HQU9_9BACL
MARRRKLIVPEAERGVTAFKAEVMRKEGYDVDPERPDDVKYEVAEDLGIPLHPGGGNGKLTTEEAGKVGGQIGGAMVREMIRLAQEKIARRE